MPTRTERHREMAEIGVREHQALTTAHLDGRAPKVVDRRRGGKATIFYTAQQGERVVERGFVFGATEMALRELQMYWRRIPDFGVTDYKVFANESGWAQVLYWSGTGDDGRVYSAQEADVVTTDEDFAVTRFEVYCDAKQWRDIVAFVNGGKLPAADYDELIARERGSAA
jgi:hypothetical protein